jgi:hypothetical protein
MPKPPPNPPVPVLRPDDLTSNATSIPLLVSTNYGGFTPLGSIEKEVAAIASQVQLVRLADFRPVPFELVNFDENNLLRAQLGLRSAHALEVRPLEPLASEWHLLTVISLPDWAQLPSGARVPELGVYGVRLHPASNPVVRSLTLPAGRLRAQLSISEPIVVSLESVGKSLRLTQPAGLCAWVPAADASLPQNAFNFDCPSAFGSTDTTLELRPGLSSPDGVPLRLVTGEDSFSRTVTADEIAGLPDGIVTW